MSLFVYLICYIYDQGRKKQKYNNKNRKENE
jgi:hypothetical protein